MPCAGSRSPNGDPWRNCAECEAKLFDACFAINKAAIAGTHAKSVDKDTELRKWAVEQSVKWRAAVGEPYSGMSSQKIAVRYYKFAKGEEMEVW